MRNNTPKTERYRAESCLSTCWAACGPTLSSRSECRELPTRGECAYAQSRLRQASRPTGASSRARECCTSASGFHAQALPCIPVSDACLALSSSLSPRAYGRSRVTPPKPSQRTGYGAGLLAVPVTRAPSRRISETRPERSAEKQHPVSGRRSRVRLRGGH